MWHNARRFYRYLPFPLQKALVAGYGRLILRDRFAADYNELERFLERSERSDPELLREYQEERLRRIVRHAYETVPHYREVMDSRGLRPSDIVGIDDLVKLPVLRKEDARSLGRGLRSSAVRRTALARAGTSATSGSPLAVYRDRSVSLMNHACYMRLRRWAGFPLGTPYATMQGRLVVPHRQRKPPYWRHNPSWNQLLLSTVHLTDENMKLYVDKIREFGARALEAFPSCAFILARYLETRGDYLPMDAVTTTGEPLLPLERRLIEERFRARAFDAYSTAERVVFSTECERHDGHHVYDEFGITEVVDNEGNRLPLGVPGLLVGTSLHNFGTPMIRYACGDVGTLSDRRCECGRTLSMMEGITSRVGDIIVTPDGRMIPAIMVSWSIKDLAGVRQWRIVQRRPDEIRMMIVKDAGLTERERATMLAYFDDRLGPDVRVEIEQVSEIPPSAMGKVRHVISEVPLVWGSANRWPDREAVKAQ